MGELLKLYEIHSGSLQDVVEQEAFLLAQKHEGVIENVFLHFINGFAIAPMSCLRRRLIRLTQEPSVNQASLANILEVSEGQISGFLSGEKNLGKENVAKCVIIFNLKEINDFKLAELEGLKLAMNYLFKMKNPKGTSQELSFSELICLFTAARSQEWQNERKSPQRIRIMQLTNEILGEANRLSEQYGFQPCKVDGSQSLERLHDRWIRHLLLAIFFINRSTQDGPKANRR